MAVLCAAAHVQMKPAYGGPYAGQLANQVMEPQLVGYQSSYDPYGFKQHPHGDVATAKQQLTMCGKPNGFSTTIAARQNRPADVAAAPPLRAALAKLGVKT